MTIVLDVATRKGLFTLRREASGWQTTQVQFLGDPVSIVHFDQPTGALYAALDHGHFGAKIQRSMDGG